MSFRYYIIVVFVLLLITNGKYSNTDYFTNRMPANHIKVELGQSCANSSTFLINKNNLNAYNLKLNKLEDDLHDVEGFEDFDFSYFRELVSEKKGLDGQTVESTLASIEIINRKYNNFLTKDFVLQEIGQQEIHKIKRIMNYIKDNAPNGNWDKEFTSYFVNELYFITRGRRASLDPQRFFSFSKYKQDILTRIASEQILNEGLVATLATLPNAQKSIKFSFVKKWRNAKSHPIFKVAQSLLLLPPDLKNIKIPDQLMQKIILEGYEVNKKSFSKIIYKQLALEAYRDARTVYNVAYSMFFAYQAYFLYEYVNELIDVKIQENSDNFENSINDLGSQISNLKNSRQGKKKTKEEIKEELKLELLNGLFEKIQQEQGRKPTPAEISLFKKQFPKLFESK